MQENKRQKKKKVVYDPNHYFGFCPKPNPKFTDTFGRYRNHISKEEVIVWGILSIFYTKTKFAAK